MRYALSISYLGTKYAGWQVQPNALTVQEELDKALAVLLREKIDTTGAGRTDAGVHATELIVHFDFEGELPPNFLRRINGILPADISVKQVLFPTKPDFNARFDAVARGYQYFISAEKNVFLQPYTWYRWGDLSLEKMNEAAQLLLEYDDFASFAKAGGQNKTTFCKIYTAKFEIITENTGFSPIFPFEKQHLLRFHIRADRFLRGMVRGIVGTLVEVGEGRISVADFQAILEKKDRKSAGNNAPAEGLFLTEVAYPEGTFQQLL